MPHHVPIGPEFDLHAFAPRDIPDVVDAYLQEAHALGLREVRLVHRREATLSNAAQAFLAVIEAQTAIRKGRFAYAVEAQESSAL